MKGLFFKLFLVILGMIACGRALAQAQEEPRWMVTIGPGTNDIVPLSLEVLYSPQPIFSVGLDYSVFGFPRFNYAHSFGDVFHTSLLMASVRGNWIRKKNFALYSEAELGGVFTFKEVAWHIKPAGIRLGDRIFFHAALGVGWKYLDSPYNLGLEAGIGFRF